MDRQAACLARLEYPFTQKDPPNMRPRLVIPLGDPAGIGPEVVLKALTGHRLSTQADITLLGCSRVLATTAERLQAQGIVVPPLSNLSLIDEPAPSVVLGQASQVSGAASFRWLDRAIARTLAGEFQGIVTAPIAKAAWKQAGHDYPGQTELLAERANTQHYGMAFVATSPQSDWTLRCLLATTHIPLRQVAETLTADWMSRKLSLLIAWLRQDFGLQQPRIAIAGLNPHSGEQGQLGHEEQTWLIPWLKQMQQQYPQAVLEGPVPPDTLWVTAGQAWSQHNVATPDAYLALYHDQGLIPVKLLAFNQAVNTTIGLPFVRTSPDHGTAFDLAGLGVAQADSMQAAIALATRLAQNRLLEPAQSVSEPTKVPGSDPDPELF
jgi:4-hydroxythreonine-4-phosphate dehydrogenase